MAGDWVKIEKTTAQKPEVLALASILNIHPDHAFGLCVRFWFWCDDQLKTCHAKSVTNVTLDYVVGHTGFTKALIEVGWLLVREGSLEVPNFDRHLSESAKKRADSQRRKRKQRAESVTDMSQKKRDKSVTREEKRREENNTPKSPFSECGWIIPKCLDSDRGRALVEKYAEVQRGQGHIRKHDAVAFQATLSHLDSFSTRKAMGLLGAWIEARQAIPKYDADWESYAPAESDLPPTAPKVQRERKPRVEVPQA